MVKDLRGLDGEEVGRQHGSLPFCVSTLLKTVSTLISMAFVAMILSATPAVAVPLKVKTTATAEKGYGRIVLDFERLPEYESDIDDTILVFKFKQAIGFDFEDLVRRLSNYISVARVDPDGRAFRFAFTDSFKVNVMEAGTKIFIDILGREWSGMPPNLPQDVLREIARRASEIEAENFAREQQKRRAKEKYKVRLRTGALPTFTRLVFDWEKFVTAKLERRGDTVNLTFGQPSELDVGRVRHDLPKFLLDIKSESTDVSTIVSLSLPSDAKVRGYREGEDYVVDISPSDVGLSEELKQLQIKVKDDEGKAVGQEEVLISGRKTDVIPMDEFSGAGEDVKMVRSKFSDFNPDRYNLSMYGDSPDAVGLPALGKKVVGFDQTGGKSIDDGEPIAADVKTGKASKRKDQHLPYLKDMEDHNEIFFPFKQAVAAAGFIRGDTVWIIFDSFVDIDLSRIMESGSRFIKDIRKSKLNNGQLILFKLKKPMLFALEYNDFVWSAKIGDMVTAKAEVMKLRRKKTVDKKPYVSVSVERPSHAYWLKDESIGDRIGMVTTYPPVHHISKPQDFVEFSSYGTAQGIAISPKTDDIEIRVGFQEVVISRYDGLHLSDGSIPRNNARKPRSKKVLKDYGYIDFDQWRSAGNGTFADQMGNYEARIAEAEDDQKYEVRRDYARFLLANELAPESYGMLERILMEKPERQNEPEIRVLQGAANVMMRRPKDALKALSSGMLHTNEHASLWRGMAKIMLEQWSDAVRQFRNGEDAVGLYPDVQRARFMLAAAKAAKKLQNFALMGEYLQLVPREVGDEMVDVDTQLINAQYLNGLGNREAARELFEAVILSEHAPAVAQAKVDLLKLDLKENKINTEKAIALLEGMQLMWRGDDTEVEMLSHLSNLYASNGHYRQAFANMKQAVKAFPANDSALKIQDDMGRVFKSLFLQNKVTKMRPIEALSLFYDYKELTPIGRAGDEMIRMLADRLIDVDLLDHAAELLDHQVSKRVHGSARSQVAAKLAMVHLMNRKPVLALQTIGRTRQPNLPRRVKRARDVLEARALSEMGRVDGAIDILNRMEGEEIERMKADAYWNARQWGNAGDQIEKLLGTRWNQSESLQPFERKDVLRAAISYSLAEDAFALSRLRKKFYNKMVNSPDASSFIVVTKPVKKNGEAYKKLAKDIAAINTLDVFMKQYRNYYKDSISAGKILSGPSNQES